MEIDTKDKINESIKIDKNLPKKENITNRFNEIKIISNSVEYIDERIRIIDVHVKLIEKSNGKKVDNKWENINWSKVNFHERKRSKWDKIDWHIYLTGMRKEDGKNKKHKNYEKIEEFIIENLDDISMHNDNNNENHEILKIFHDNPKNSEKNDNKDDFQYRNLVYDKLKAKFNEYHNKTGKYANWGIKIRKDFIFWLDKKLENNDISIREKNNIMQLKNLCKEINNSQEIKEFITEKILNSNLRLEEISKESKKLGINLSLSTLSRIYQELYKNKKIRRKNYWAFLDQDEFGNKLDHDEVIKKCAKYLTDNILTDSFRKKNGLKEGEAPCIDTNNKKIIRFRGAIGYRKLSYNEILVEAGLKLNLEVDKWSFLDFDENKVPLRYKQSIKKAADYLKNNIITNVFKQKYGLKKDEAPTISLGDKRFNQFLSAIGGRNLFYNDILREVGLRLNLEIGKWSFLDYDENKKLLSYEEAIEKAADYLKNNILTNDFKKKYGLKKDEAPSIDTVDSEMMKFRGAIGSRGLSYIDILREVGLRLNLEIGKWSFLDYDENKKVLSYEEAIEKAADYFKSELFTEEFREKKDLGKDRTPTMNVNDNEVQRFFSAISKRNLSYNDILEKAGFNTHESSLFAKIGKYIHWIQEYLFLKHTRGIGCTSFYEPYINIKTDHKNNDLYKKYVLNHCDTAIIFDGNITVLSKEAQHLYNEKRKSIKLLTFDFFLGNSQKYIKKHCLKGYQNHERMLILIPFHSASMQSPPKNIPYSYNVRIVDPINFSIFLGYKDMLLDRFLKSIELAKRAPYDSKAFERLCEIALKCKEKIIEKYNYSHIELEKFIKRKEPNSRMSILKYRPGKTNLEQFLDTNNSKNN